MDDNYENSSKESLVYDTTEKPPFEFKDYNQRVIVATLYLIVILIGTIGNTLVILAVLLSKKLRTATNAFVVNLSIADLLTCLVLPWTVVATLSKDGLPVGEWVCGMAAVVQATAIGCSLYTLASIGLQRLLLITRPVTTYRDVYTPKKIAVWLVITWFIPLLVTLLPPLLGVGAVGYNKKYHHCGFPSTHPRSNDYDVIIAGGLYPIPLITIIVCYILIWRHLYRHAKKVRIPESSFYREPTTTNVSTVSGSSVGTLKSSNAQQPPARSRSTLRQSRVGRRQYEITKNMFYIVCAFILCLTPFAVCLFYDDSDPFLPYASVILVFNSCINPLIYATKHRDFKIVFNCILRHQWHTIPEPSGFLKKLIGKRHRCGRAVSMPETEQYSKM